MQVVTIREAKARLNALVEAAIRGEQVVLMRGSRHVAAIVPVSADDLELAPHLTDQQAERFWRRLEAERADGASLVFETAEKAVEHLSSEPPAVRRRSRTSTSRKSPRQRRG
jgi:antitoxin (DNA-binding transcriptional repressor) of toxin-antitoxin stability system